MLDEQTVIGLFVEVESKIIDDFEYYVTDFLLLVDDKTKEILDKFIYIYSSISDYLNKEGITLKDVLADIDLYVAAAAAIDT
jgi:hypothetical protein